MYRKPQTIIFRLLGLLVVIGALAGFYAVAGSTAPAEAAPRIISPVSLGEYIFGEPIPFIAIDDNHDPACNEGPFDLLWSFRRDGALFWQDYQFTPDRLLSANGQNHVMPFPGEYEVKVKMCDVESELRSFTVAYDHPLNGALSLHPNFSDPDDGQYMCFIDWEDPEDDNHKTTAHFNAFWNTTVFSNLDQDDDGCPDPVDPPQVEADIEPNDAKMGLLECVYATLDYYMTSPLENNSLYRLHEDYDHLTHLTFFAGGPGGGGTGIPQGLGYGQAGRYSNWLPTHELFHPFDYAGNPLHLRIFDWRQINNAYVFFHESPTRVEQTMADDAGVFWGYPTDQWPSWMPVDLGLLELDYDAGLFWSYVINTYGYEPRLTWDGPDIDACEQLKLNQPPHNFKFFEDWNRRVRERIALDMDLDIAGGPELISYANEWCSDRHMFRDTGGDRYFLYNGELDPSCLQSVEYEMWVLENMVRERNPFEGLPLEESLILDFAVAYAKAFPPLSLLTSGMPESILCQGLQGISFGSSGDAEHHVCDPDIADDFYARIRFKIEDPTAKFLRLQANDDATLYMDGKAIIGQQDPRDTYFDEDYPDASSTYADLTKEEWADLVSPQSSVFPVGDVHGKSFEIEWVNRGDGRGNNDCRSGECLSRYYLELWKYDPLTGEFTSFAGLEDFISVESAEFWPRQGSGEPGFDYDAVPEPHWWDYASEMNKEIALRPVSQGERPFLLPGLGINYHPVACPTDFAGEILVQVRDDDLTHTRPSVSLMTINAAGAVQWQGRIAEIGRLQNVVLECDGSGGPAASDGETAFLLVTTSRTRHADTPNGTMGAIHYTVFVRTHKLFMMVITKPDLSGMIPQALTPTPSLTPLPTPTLLPPLPSQTPEPYDLRLHPVADSYVSAAYPYTNYGSLGSMYVGKSTTTIGRSLMRFDLSGFPADATLLSAALEANLSSTSIDPASLDVEVRQVEYPWSETSLTWNNQPPTSSIGKINPVGTEMGYYSWDVTAMVQDWLQGNKPNYGLALWSYSEELYGWRGFDSRENSSGNTPSLRLWYVP